MNGKGSGQIFGALWLLRILSRIVGILVLLSVPFTFFFYIFIHSFFRFPLWRGFIIDFVSLHSIQQMPLLIISLFSLDVYIREKNYRMT